LSYAKEVYKKDTDYVSKPDEKDMSLDELIQKEWFQ
jgi:hypothetical protein